jgi:L-aspartate oxidase
VLEGYIGESFHRRGPVCDRCLARKRGGIERLAFPAKAVVLASGGIGHLYASDHQPGEANGHGLAMAARAGAVIADAEFVQFHPTALDLGKDPAPLATEALRGEGATLVNKAGERFMEGVHADLELAPRDIVARAIHRETLGPRCVSRLPDGYRFPLQGRFPDRLCRLPVGRPRSGTQTSCRSRRRSITTWAAS